LQFGSNKLPYFMICQITVTLISWQIKNLGQVLTTAINSLSLDRYFSLLERCYDYL